MSTDVTNDISNQRDSQERDPALVPLHPLLLRQSKRAGITTLHEPVGPQTFQSLARKISDSYTSADADHKLLQNALDLSSKEMEELNRTITDERNRLQLFLNAIGDGVCALNPSGQIITANPAALSLLGLTESQALGFALMDFLEDLPTTIQWPVYDPSQKGHQRAILHGPLNQHLPISYLRTWLNSQTNQGESVIVFRDIRKEIAMERHLENARRAADDASHAKSEFLANMSHEIRTPMNGMLGMAELALGTVLTEDQREYIEAIRSSGDSLLGILNDILDFSKIEAGEIILDPTLFDLSANLHQIVRSVLGAVWKKGLILNSRIDPDVPFHLIGDDNRLRQILLNLLSNAIKFTEKGSICVSVHLAEHQASSCLLRFSVKDTGLGMDPSQLNMIFEPFKQADGGISRRFGGTGLGLAICRKLVGLLGGQITVLSQKSVGSEFIFTARFDVSAAEARPAQRTDTYQQPTQLRTLKILMAEDNPVNQKVLRRLLEREGHTVVVACNGVEAVEKIQQQDFDVVFMDVQMPELDGLEATRAIRSLGTALGETIPIIAMTAHAMKGDREECLAAGMNSYLSKPVRPEALRRELQALLTIPITA